MARIPDHKNKKKRTKTVLLSEEAYLLWKEIKRNAIKWSFSDFVNKKMIEEYSKAGSKKNFLLNRLIELQAQMDDMERAIREVAEAITDLSEDDRLREKTVLPETSPGVCPVTSV